MSLVSTKPAYRGSSLICHDSHSLLIPNIELNGILFVRHQDCADKLSANDERSFEDD